MRVVVTTNAELKDGSAGETRGNKLLFLEVMGDVGGEATNHYDVGADDFVLTLGLGAVVVNVFIEDVV